MFRPRLIAAAVDKIARQAIGKDWALYAALLDHWQEIVGTEYARLTLPVKIAFPPKQSEARRTGGTLTIRLPKGLAMEFTFKTEQIRQRIAAYFGHEAVSRIVFEPVYGLPNESPAAAEVDPETLAAFKDKTKTIDDEELRSALEAFGESMLKSSRHGN